MSKKEICSPDSKVYICPDDLCIVLSSALNRLAVSCDDVSSRLDGSNILKFDYQGFYSEFYKRIIFLGRDFEFFLSDMDKHYNKCGK